jgi:hypothetical protein
VPASRFNDLLLSCRFSSLLPFFGWKFLVSRNQGGWCGGLGATTKLIEIVDRFIFHLFLSYFLISSNFWALSFCPILSVHRN